MPRRNLKGNPYQRWGNEPQRDVDQLAHWITDIDRTVDRLEAIREAMRHSLIEIANKDGNGGEMMDFAAKLAGQVTGKANGLYKSLVKRRTVNGGSFKRKE